MDKKSLLAFVMTAPVMSMFASNWGYSDDADGYLSYTLAPNFEQGNWVSANSSLPDPTDKTASVVPGRVVISNLCPSISSNVDLPQGDYYLVLNQANLINAVISINIPGEDPIEIKANTNVNTVFEQYISLEKQSTLKVTVKPIDGTKSWYVPTLEFQLQYNFKDQYQTLQTDWNSANADLKTNHIKYPNESTRKTQIAALKATYDSLVKEKNALQPKYQSLYYGDLNEIVSTAKSETEEQTCTRLLASYNTYYCYNDPNQIASDMSELLNNIENYLSDVDAENEICETIVKNTDDKKKFTEKNGEYSYDGLTTALNNAKSGFSAANFPSNVKNPLKAYLEYIDDNAKSNIVSAIAAFKKAVNDAYADLQSPVDFDSLKNQYICISNQIKAFEKGYPEAQKDWAAYSYFLSPASNGENASDFGVAAGSKNLADVELVQSDVFQKIDAIGNKNYGGDLGTVYFDQIKTYKAFLNDIYKSNRGYTINPEGGLESTNPNIAGASLNYPDANTDMLNRIQQMPAVYADVEGVVLDIPGFTEALMTLVARQDAAYNAAKTNIGNVVISVTESVGEDGKPVYTNNTVKDGALATITNLQKVPGYNNLAAGVKTALDQRIAAITTAYSDYNNLITSLYKAHDIDGNSKVATALKKFTDAVKSYNNYVNSQTGDLSKSLAVMGQYAETKANVENTFAGLDHSTELNGIFTTSFTTLGKWVNDYIAQLGVVSGYLTEMNNKNNEIDKKQEELVDLKNTQLRATQSVTVVKNGVTVVLPSLTELKATAATAKAERDAAEQEFNNALADKTLPASKLQEYRTAYVNAQQAYDEAQAAVDALIAAIAEAKVKQPKVEDEIKALIDGVATADANWKNATAKLGEIQSSINDACADIEANAALLDEAFRPVEKDLKSFKNASNDLQKNITSVDNNVVKVTVSGDPAYTYKVADASVTVKIGSTTKAWTPSDLANQSSSFDAILTSIAKGSTAVTIGSKTFDCSNPTEFLNAANALDEAWETTQYVYEVENGTKKFKSGSFTDVVNQARENLAETVATANLDAIKALDQLLNGDEENPSALSELKSVNAPGAANITVQQNFKPGYTGYKSIEEAKAGLDAAAAKTTTADMVNAYAQADGKMKQFAEAYQISLNTVKPVYENYSAWRKLRNALGLGVENTTLDVKGDVLGVDYVDSDIDGINMNPILNQTACATKLQQAINYVNAITDEKAKGHYNAILQEIHDKIILEGEKVTNQYKAGTADDNYKTLLAEIDAINADIKKVQDDCLANQQKYGALSSEIDNLSKYAQSVYDYISENDEVDSNKKEWLKKVTDQITDLNNLSVALNKSFEKGSVVVDAAVPVTGYTDALETIRKELKAIESQENSTYQEAVDKANKKFLDERGISYESLYNYYESAVDSVNHYRDDIKNPGYYAYLVGNDDFQKAHFNLLNEYKALEAYNTSDKATNWTGFDAWFNSLAAGKDRSKYVVLASFLDPDGDDILPQFKGSKMPSAQEQKNIQGEYEKYLEAAQAIRKQIDLDLNGNVANGDEFDGVTTIAFDLASDYYEENFTNAGQKYYNQIWNALANAGLSTEWPTYDDPSQVYDVLISEQLTGFSVSNRKSMYNAYWNILNLYEGLVVHDQELGFQANPDQNAKPTTDAKFVTMQKLIEKGDYYQYILKMNAIANDIDALIPNPQNGLSGDEFVNAVANLGVNLQWTSFITGPDGVLTDLQYYLEESVKDPGYGDTAAIQKAIDLVNSKNAEWKKQYDAGKCAAKDNYTKKVEELLNAKVNSTQTVADVLNDGKTYDTDTKIAKAKDQLLGSGSPFANANDALDELLRYSGYHKDQLSTIFDYQSAINGVVDDINDAKAGVIDQVEDFAEQLDNITEELKGVDAYQTIFNEECEYANTMLLAKAQKAYNNANINPNITSADLKDYLDEINSLPGEVAALQAKPFTDANMYQRKDEIRALENQYCQLIVDLEKLAGTSFDRTDLGVAVTTFSDLLALDNAEVQRYLDAVDAAEYGEYSVDTKAIYDPKFGALKADLVSIGEQVNTSDPAISLIYTIDQFKYELDQISTDAKEIKAAWDKQNATDADYYGSDLLYTQYNDALTVIVDNVNKAHDLLKTNLPDEVDGYNGVMATVTQSKGLNSVLADAKKNHIFVKNGEKTDAFKDFKSKFDKFNAEQAIPYVQDALSDVFESLRDANLEIIQTEIDKVVANADPEGTKWQLEYLHYEELLDELLAQQTKLEKLYNSKSTDYKTNPIYYVVNPKDSKKSVLSDSSQAWTGYDSLNTAMDAIMTAVDGIVNGPVGEKYLKGDVNNDGDLTVADVQKLIDMIGEGVEYVPGDTDSETADVNSDNAINIADVTALINRVLNEQKSPAKIARFMPRMSGNNSFSVEEIEGENGLRRFVVALNNEVDFVSGQLDINLPGFAHVAGVTLADRANALESFVYENNGFTRVILTSLDNAAIQGNSGALLYIDVDGDAEIEVENLIFSDANANSYNVNGNGTTGVGILDTVKDGVKAIYNAAGQKLRNLTKGVNIIRNADGTTTKKIGK